MTISEKMADFLATIGISPHLLPCPFCGRKLDDDLIDNLYPTGQGWVDEDGFRHYVNYRQAPKGQWCWQIHCSESSGGCGANITGDNIKEVISKWNTRSS